MIQAINLKIAYMKNPIGIDEKNPVLTWKCRDAIKQSAYEIEYNVQSFGAECRETKIIRANTDIMEFRFEDNFKSRDIVSCRIRLTNENGIQGEWSEYATFEMGLLEKSDWKATFIMGDYDHEKNPKMRYPVDYFRKKFTLSGKVKHARLYMTACGLYETYLNGEKVGDQVFAPGATAFQKRAHYQVYDVTEMFSQKTNSWTIELADGFYASKTGVFGKAKTYGHEPKVMGQLEIVYEDGTVEDVCTDEKFEWSNDGPIRLADMKDGEIVDYSCTPSYSGNARTTQYDGILCASNNVPVREQERFANPTIIKCPDGHTVLDFHQNIAGYVETTLCGANGKKCQMVFGEKLDKNGNFTYKNISWEGEYDTCHFQTADIICDSNKHVYKSKFTVMGFRYVLLLEWPEEIKPENFTAIAVYSDMDTSFEFASSDNMLNQIVKNTFWSVKGNFLDVPTDCPTRERAGWTGDAQLFFNTGNYMMDQRSFFHKWLQDVVDSQKKNGLIYNINPSNPNNPQILEWLSVEGGAGWGDALIMIPYYYWKRYGDDSLMKKFWEPMKKCFEFYKGRMGKRNLLSLLYPPRTKFDKYLCACGRDFGEWTEPEDCAPSQYKMMIPMAEEATAYLSYDAALMSEMAMYIKENDLADEYKKIAEKTKESYNYYFVKDGKIETNRMCKFVRPCGLKLVDDKVRSVLLSQIVKLNRERDYKIGTGFLTTPFVFECLSEAGESDDAYRMLVNPELGWVQQINNGATTVWENWTDDASLNHYSKGACCQWIFDTVCGIKLSEQKNHFIIKPHLVSDLDEIEMSYDSVYGKVVSGWKRVDGSVRYHIVIPANTEAKVTLPGEEARVLCAGKYNL